jgi:hypothetical protein
MPGMTAIPNIGPKEIRKRHAVGVVALVTTFVLSATLIGFDAAWWIKLIVFFPAWIAGGLFQAREKT